VQWFRPASISRINAPTEQDWRTLQLTDGTLLQTRLLVLAEGGDSPGRQLAGIEVLQQDYQQTALIANIGISGSHQNRAFERFTADGPLALLPLPPQPLSSQPLSQPSLSQQPLSQQPLLQQQARDVARYSLVWTLTPAEAQRLQQCPPAQFLAELQQAFGYRAGEFIQVGNRVCYPLALKRASQAASHRLVLCGNSLHSLHPIAGQGFNLALRDIAALVSLVGLHADAGSYALVRQYAQLREADMATVISFTDAMVRLFSNQSRIMALGRNLALSQLNHCSALKALFAGQSMGLTPLLKQQRSLLQHAEQQANHSTPDGGATLHHHTAKQEQLNA
jgi:2-octaprenyl-6-methoxyphenol hydroxylase